jgi:hypothetical protein
VTLPHLKEKISASTRLNTVESSPQYANNVDFEMFLEIIWRSTKDQMTVKNEINATSVVKTNQSNVI